MLGLARGLLAQGVEVDLVVLEDKGPLRTRMPSGTRLVVLGKDVWNIPGGRLLLLRMYVSRAVNYLERERPDAVLSTLEAMNIVAVMAKLSARHRFRLVVRRANHFSMQKRYLGMLNRWVLATELDLARYADAVVVNSHASAADLASQAPALTDALQVIPNPSVGPDTAARAAGNPEHPWFGPDQPPVVLAVGRLVKSKDHATLLRAFAAARRHRELRLVILGRGTERERLARLAERLSIDDALDLPGFCIEPLPYMRTAALFVIPSVYEGCSNALIEAMACGTAVVSTDHPSAREVLMDGALGRIVPVGDHQAMAKAILRALDGGGVPAQRLRDAARRYSAEPSVERYAATLLGDRETGRARRGLVAGVRARWTLWFVYLKLWGTGICFLAAVELRRVRHRASF